tara:strand:+ start:114638 stop:115144 length:507 start_codon:yes stop_codon:yes gene_type:complete
MNIRNKKDFLTIPLLVLSFAACSTTSNGKKVVATSSQQGFFDTELPKKYPSVFFDSESASVSAEQKVLLKNIAQDINGYNQADHTITIEGYTDATGSKAYNKQLAYKRAQNVKEILQDYGVESQNITIKSLGEDQLSNDDQQANLKNRRVMIKTNDEYKTYSINIPRF